MFLDLERLGLLLVETRLERVDAEDPDGVVSRRVGVVDLRLGWNQRIERVKNKKESENWLY
jgi:hypothetical protein